MRKVKYLLSIFFLFLGFLFIADLYAWNLKSFELPYISTTMYLPEGVSQEEMVSEIEAASKENKCEIFAVDRNITSIFSETTTIYGNDHVKKYLMEKSFVKPGKYKSIFLGQINVRAELLEKIPDISKCSTFYIIGDKENAARFKQKLVDKYSGNFPKEGYVYFNSERTVLTVWLVCFLLFLLLTLYETVLLKKEIVIRFIYGESLKQIVVKRIISDWVTYGASFLISLFVVKRIWGLPADFHIDISIIGILLFGIADALVYLTMFLTNYKKDISTRISEKAVIKVSYIYKAVTSAAIIFLMSASIELVISGLQFYQQNDFFQNYAQYSYVMISHGDETIESSQEMRFDFYKAQNHAGNSFSSVYLDNGSSTGRPCLFADSGSLSYLKTQIPELADQDIKGGIYFIIPENKADKEIQDLNQLWNMYDQKNDKYKVVEYHETARIMGIYRMGKIVSRLYKNPLIILNMDADQLDQYKNYSYIVDATLFRIDKKDWRVFTGNNNVKESATYMTNACDNYQRDLKGYQRNILLGLVTLLFLIVIEIIIIRTTLRYECSINAVEITLKTVLGYSVFERYRKLFLTTIFAAFLSFAVCIVIAGLYDISTLPCIAIGCIIIILMELLLLFYYIGVMERSNIQKALKGGRI